MPSLWRRSIHFLFKNTTQKPSAVATTMTWKQQPQAASLLLLLCLLISFCDLFVYAVPSSQDDRLNRLQNHWLKDLQQESNDSPDFKEVSDDGYDSNILHREKRRIDLPDLEVDGSDNDPYTIIEESDDCFWCNTDTPEDDDEYRAATIYTHSVTVPSGTCVINQSPSWPALYPNDVDHRWTYTTSAGSQLTFSVPVGGLQISRGCYRDKLNIRVGTTTVKKCGQFYSFQIHSRSKSTMYIRFASNHRIRWHGYRGTVCASAAPTTKTTPAPVTTTTPPESTTTTTPPPPIYCDDICGNLAGYTGFSGRISTGTQANQSYPWVIIVDIMRDQVFVRCSGYLISRKHIITSAYCFYQETPQGIDDTTVRVTAGEYDISSAYEVPAAQVLYTTNITLYPSFNASNGGGVYNMAILTMPGDGFDLNTRVAPICLANTTVKTALAGRNSFLSLTGFGWTKNDYPSINLTTASVKTCPFLFPDVDLFCIYIPSTASTPCQGDAGAAIYKKWIDNKYYAIGHVNAVTVDNCPLTGFVFPCPAVAYYLTWLEGITGPRLCNM